MNKYKASRAVFITPENPFSQNLSGEENCLRHNRFTNILNGQNLKYLKGYGASKDASWGREDSYLIFIEDEMKADKLAGALGQNAYLVIEQGRSPRLKYLQPLQYRFNEND